jgi:hypothetical protein
MRRDQDRRLFGEEEMNAPQLIIPVFAPITFGVSARTAAERRQAPIYEHRSIVRKVAIRTGLYHPNTSLSCTRSLLYDFVHTR